MAIVPGNDPELQAHAAFMQLYAQKFPPPSRKASNRAAAALWLPALGLIIVLLASMIVSGSRSIREFSGNSDDPLRQLIGWAGFISVDVSAVFLRFFMISLHAKSDQSAMRRWVVISLCISTAVMVGVNLAGTSHVVTDYAIALPAEVMTVIFGLIALAPIAQGIATADILGHLWRQYRESEISGDESYEERTQQWREQANEAWKTSHHRRSVLRMKEGVRVESASPEALPPSATLPMGGRQTARGKSTVESSSVTTKPFEL